MLNSQAKTRVRLLEAKYRRNEKIILVDCGAFSELALLDSYKKDKRINKKQECIYKDLRKQILFDFVYENMIIYVHIPLEKENERIKKEIKIISQEDISNRSIINPEFIKNFNITYEEIYKNDLIIKRLKEGMKFIRVDGSKKVKENTNIIVKEIKKMQEKM
jgi:hypothetical protein